MAKSSNQKLKLLYLVQIFSEYTDEINGLTLKEILNLLDKNGINAERKTLYQDFEALRQFGYDIVSEKKNYQTYYRLVSRDFELPELKLLVDSVQSAKFISEKKSRELIKKLETLVSKHDAKQLQRQVSIAGRIKTMNESIYYSIDQIHSAIIDNKKIRFQYFQWNLKKEPELRHDGAWYHISPWALIWNNEYYYLVGYDTNAQKIKHYRVDKMLHLSVSDEEREGQTDFEAIDLSKYSKGLFRMFSGEEENVTLLCDNDIVGTIIDRFGQNILIHPVDGTHFKTWVNVSFSNQFLGWVFALGTKVKIIGPEHLVDTVKAEIAKLSTLYSNC